MNTQPVQPFSAHDRQSNQSSCLSHNTLDCSDRAATVIDAARLAHIAELLDVLDGFLRCGNGVADRLADYLHATGRDRPQPPHGASYDTNLLIDQVSFTAHALRTNRAEPLE